MAVLRTQAGSVAQATLSKLVKPLKDVDPVCVSVEGGIARGLVENAFVELLNQRGISTTPQPRGVGRRTLQVAILEQTVRYSGLATGEYRREVRTSIETRDVSADSSSVEYLGIFNNAAVDTVEFREEFGLTASVRDGERTLFDKLVGPVVLIGGAFLVVYLFFTVRN